MSPLPGTIQDREYKKFGLNEFDQTCVRVLTYPGEDAEPDGYEKINLYDEAAAVPTGVETLIAAYTVPVGKSLLLSLIQASGQNIGTFSVFKNAQRIAKARTWFNGSLIVDFVFSDSRGLGLLLNAGDNLEIKAIHQRPNSGDFEARILGVLKNA